MNLTLHEIARRLGGEVFGDEVLALGPRHSEKDRSLSVRIGRNGDIVCYSHAGDDWQRCKDDAIQRIGLPAFKLGNGSSKRIQTFEYRDSASGEIRYRKERRELADGEKTFRITPKGRGGGEPLLYGSERLADLGEGQPVWIVEGEKKVDRLRELSAIAVCADSGAKSRWLPEHANLLRGLPIILWPDSDAPGEQCIANAARCLEGHAASTRVVRPFGAPNGSKGKDACDWHGNAEALARLAQSAEPYAPLKETTAPDFTRKVKRGGDFLAEYSPIRYTFDGLLPCGSFYTLTGKTGAGKTSLAQPLALSTITGRNLIGFDPEPGRAAYIILENPTDFRMKLAVNAYVHGADHELLNEKLAVLDMHLPHDEILRQLQHDAEDNGPFCLVVYDTFQAGFSGAQFNDNAEILIHAQQIRRLTSLPGNPAVLAPAHPVKNATKDNLLPYGGGSTVNEIDGNLSLWSEDRIIELGWTKVRSPEFEPRFFKIEKLGSPDILDSEGRTPLLPVMRAMNADSVERRERVIAEMDAALLQIIASNPKGTQRQWAAALGKSLCATQHTLDKLKKQRLVATMLGKWRLTKDGIKAVKSCADADKTIRSLTYASLNGFL
jgi:AAA domain